MDEKLDAIEMDTTQARRVGDNEDIGNRPRRHQQF